MKYYFGGVNGVGKTTVLRLIEKALPELKVVHGTSLLMDRLGIPGDYYALRAISQVKLRPEYTAAVHELFETYPAQDILLDSHYLNIRYGEIDVVAEDWLSLFDALLLVSAKPELIWQRLSNDAAHRDRALLAADTTQQEQELTYLNYILQTESVFHKFAQEHKVQSFIIDNSTTPETAAQSFITYRASLATVRQHPSG